MPEIPEIEEAVRDIHTSEYKELHPEMKPILEALCGPIDPLTGFPQEELGMKGQMTQVVANQTTMKAQITDIQKNGKKLEFDWKQWLALATIAGALIARILGVEVPT